MVTASLLDSTSLERSKSEKDQSSIPKTHTMTISWVRGTWTLVQLTVHRNLHTFKQCPLLPCIMVWWLLR